MERIRDRWGVDLSFWLFEPEGDPRGIVHVIHGVGEHHARHRALIDALTDAGWLVVADDHRGHGMTGVGQWGADSPKQGRLGPGGHEAAVAGVRLVTEAVRARYPDLPVAMFGHSWGSFIAQILLNRYPNDYAAVILCGSALRWPGSLNMRPLNARWKSADATGYEWLATDPSIGTQFDEDPLTTSATLVKLFGVRGALQIIGRPARGLPDVPLLLVVGRDDSVGGPVSVHRLAQAYRSRSGMTDVTTIVYDGRHEILHEPVALQVRRDILAWLAARLSDAPAPTVG